MDESRLFGPIEAILGRHPEVAAAWLFGSQARGGATSNSDLDVALLLRQRGVTARDVYPLLGRLAAELEAVSPGKKPGARQVDLVLIEQQGPILQHRILSEGRLVYEADRERRVDFESDAYVRYFDFRPTYDIARRHALQGFRDWLEARR